MELLRFRAISLSGFSKRSIKEKNVKRKTGGFVFVTNLEITFYICIKIWFRSNSWHSLTVQKMFKRKYPNKNKIKKRTKTNDHTQ